LKAKKVGNVWYAIRTGIGQEEQVRQQVKKRMPKGAHGDCRILYCVKKKKYLGQWHDKRECFLPGYLFLITEDLEPVWKETGQKPETASILGWGGICSPVRNEDAETLMKLTRGKDEIGMSYGVIRSGTLEIYEGVLRGMEASVKRIDRHKRKGYIGMRIGDEEELAEIGLEITEKT